MDTKNVCYNTSKKESIMTRKKWENSFKEEASKLVVEQGLSISQVAIDLGVSKDLLYKWVAKYKSDKKVPFPGSGNMSPEDKNTRELKKRISDLEKENEVLKKAMAYLVRPTN